MSFKEWLCLWLLFLGYLFFGAAVFYQIERRSEQEKLIELAEQRMQLQNLLERNFHFSSLQSQQQVLNTLNHLCGQDIFDFQIKRNVQNTDGEIVGDDLPDLGNFGELGEEDELTFKWTYYNSFFFALTTLSTIGYGNLHPSSPLSRFLVIIYSLIGIPINGIVLTQLGEFFGSTFLRAHHRYKTVSTEQQSKVGIVMDIVMYLVQGIVIFIIFPSGMFVYFEGWTFNESVYYAFVTLTTIGYGDFVAGQLPKNKDYYSLYKVVLVVWIMFGLGYLVMILGFISRAMRSKKLARLENRLTSNIKQAQSKLWHELTEEVAYVRRTLNEMYLLKFKPVYKDQKEDADALLGKKNRSQSAPNLCEWPVLRPQKRETPVASEDDEDVEEKFKKVRMRRRAGLSENLIKPRILKVRSDGDLFRIDRNATFEAPSSVAPNELLARVVDALGTTGGISSDSSSSEDEMEGGDDFMKQPYLSVTRASLQGVNGFSDEEILASEQQATEFSTGMKRNRALSDTAPLHSPLRTPSYVEQWTWAGAAATDKMRKLRRQRDMIRKSTTISQNPDPRRSEMEKGGLQVPVRGLRRMSQAAINFISNSSNKTHKWFQHFRVSDQKKKRKTHLSQSCNRLTVEKARDDDLLYSNAHPHYHTHMPNRTSELMSAFAAQIGTKKGLFPTHSPVLEQTTVAEFMTVLNVLHTRVGAQLAANAPGQLKTLHVPEPKKKSPLFSLFKNSQDDVVFVNNGDSKPNKSNRNASFSTTTTTAVADQIGANLVNNPVKRPRRFSLVPFSISCYPKRDVPDKNAWPEPKCSSPGLTSSNPSLSIPQFRRIRRRTLSSSNTHPITFIPAATAAPSPIPDSTSVSISPPQQLESVLSCSETSSSKKFSLRPKSSQKIKRFSVSPCEDPIDLPVTTRLSLSSDQTPRCSPCPSDTFSASGDTPSQSEATKSDLESVVVDKL